MEQFEDLSEAPAIMKREVFKYCISEIRLELSAFCNRSCSYCPVSFLERKDKSAKMPWEVIQRVIDNLAEIEYSGSVYFCMYNEPLYDRSFLLAVLEMVNEKLPNCTVNLISNGDYLTAEYFQELSKYKIDEFTISVHYEGIWNRDTQLERMKEVLRRIGLPMQGELAEHNRRMIYYVDSSLYASSRLRLFQMRSEDFTIHGLDRSGSLNTGIHRIKNFDHCHLVMKMMNIAYNGRIVPCCNACADVPNVKKWTYGTLQEYGDIFSAYTSARAASFRRMLFAPRRENEYTPDICRMCAVAEYDDEEKTYRMDDQFRREIYDCWISKIKCSGNEGKV